MNELGLDYFGYRKFIDGNKYLTILNIDGDKHFPTFIDENLDKLVLSSEFEKIPFGRSAYIWPSPNENKLVRLIEDLGFKYGSTVYTRHENAVYAYGFATKSNQYDAYNLYLKKQHLLDELILFFEEKFIDISNNYEFLPWWLYSDNFSLDLANHFKSPKKEYSKFERQVQLEKYTLFFNGQRESLTLNQINVLASLVEAKTMKEIGVDLQISPRTVEEYLNIIKKKFKIYNKQKLVELWNQNPLLQSLSKSND